MRNKIYKTLFFLIKLISDVVTIPAVFILAYSLKFKVGWIFQNILNIPLGQVYKHAQIEPYLNVLGLIIILWILAFYFVALLIAFLIGCFFLGDWGAKRFNKKITTTGHRLISVSIVILLLGIMQLIPVLGGLLIFAVLLLGFGAGMLQLHFIYHQSD